MSTVVALPPPPTRTARSKPRNIPRDQCRPAAVVGTLLAVDTLCLIAAVAASVFAKALLAGPVEWTGYWNLWPATPVFLAVYAASGLYSVIALSTPEEIRRVSVSSAVVFVVLAALTVSQRGARSGVTWTLVLAVTLTIALIPLGRSLARRMFGRKPWWGYPAVMFGSGATLDAAIASLTQSAGVGLVPVAVASEEEPDEYSAAGVLPVVADADLPEFVRSLRCKTYAVVALPGFMDSNVNEIIERRCIHFPSVILLRPFGGLSGLGVESRDLSGELGLEVSRRIYTRYRWIAKDAIDLALALMALILAAPLFLLIALAIVAESGRPVFYGHRRVGKGGRWFKAWKFRSMVPNADAALESYLASHPEARREWERTHKLRDDPRVSRVGDLLRRTSLDELPQLWNVVCGEMSMVGPRPVVKDEIAKYGDRIDLYYRVKGGITGLWQVSGRNDTSYEERVALDVYYIRNWSVWLDLFIMARTVAAVLFRRGAY